MWLVMLLLLNSSTWRLLLSVEQSTQRQRKKKDKNSIMNDCGLYVYATTMGKARAVTRAVTTMGESGGVNDYEFWMCVCVCML